MLKPKRLLPWLLVLIVGLSVGGYFSSLISYERIYPGVEVLGVNVGGLTRAEAERYIAPYFSRLTNDPLILTDGAELIRLSPGEDLGLEVDVTETIERAFSYARSGRILERMFQLMKARLYSIEITPELTFDPAALLKSVTELVSPWEQEPRDAKLEVVQNRVRIIPEQRGIAPDYQALVGQITSKLIQPHNRVVFIPLKSEIPTITSRFLENHQIDTEVSSFTTRFDPENANRVTNIRIAAQALDNQVIHPGETISFNEVVGPRIAAHGYREAPVILNGELVPDIGGGVCQVSSTFFNALLLAGAETVYRAPHSLPSTYVDLGRDATVAYGLIDLKMRNSLEHPLLISSRISGNALTISVYGPRPEYTYDLYTRTARVIPHNEQRIVDQGLAPGTSEYQEGRDGHEVHLYREKKHNGTVIATERIATSRYAPVDRVIYYRP